MSYRVPRYFDWLLDGRIVGDPARDVHLGYWMAPPNPDTPLASGAFEQAQMMLTRRAVAMARPGDGDRVLDVGCGFGGALALLDTVLRGSRLVGVNIDQRQLRVCSEIRSISDNWLGLAGADACALPFGRGAFDVVFCIEAMFHFESRMMFLSEAARVLRPGGRLVFTDFTFDEDGPTPPWRIETMTAALRDDYGPWPEVWLTPGALTKMTDTAGFETVEAQDWTGNTLPSYRVTAPHVGPFPSSRPDAGEVLCWLHHSGRLRYEARVLALSRIVAL